MALEECQPMLVGEQTLNKGGENIGKMLKERKIKGNLLTRIDLSGNCNNRYGSRRIYGADAEIN